MITKKIKLTQFLIENCFYNDIGVYMENSATWAQTFNSSQVGKSLSNEMSNIKLSNEVSVAETQARIAKHHGATPKTETGATNGFQTYSPATPVINQNTNYSYIKGYIPTAVTQTAQPVQQQTYQLNPVTMPVTYPASVQYQASLAPNAYAQTQAMSPLPAAETQIQGDTLSVQQAQTPAEPPAVITG